MSISSATSSDPAMRRLILISLAGVAALAYLPGRWGITLSRGDIAAAAAFGAAVALVYALVLRRRSGAPDRAASRDVS
jgi:hypothetical protein